MTICQTENRIDKGLCNDYCDKNGINDPNDRKEFYEFMESMANATYDTFHRIKVYKSVEKLNIDPNDYMMLIYNLTFDKIRDGEQDTRVRAFRNLMAIQSEQIITEQGICYMANNFLTADFSAKLVKFQESIYVGFYNFCKIDLGSEQISFNWHSSTPSENHKILRRQRIIGYNLWKFIRRGQRFVNFYWINRINSKCNCIFL